MTKYVLSRWRDEAIPLKAWWIMHKPQAKSSFAVVNEQRVVVFDQLTYVEHFWAKIPIAVPH